MQEPKALEETDCAAGVSRLNSIHLSLRASFVSLPSDPSIPLTPEQLQAVFPNPGVWRDMIALTLQQHQATSDETVEPNVA